MEPKVSQLSDGNIIIAYESALSGTDRNVVAQITSPTGVKLGSEFLITTADFVQSEVSVSSLSGGGFVAVWQSEDQDGDGRGIFLRIFDNDGSPTSGEILANNTTASHQSYPKIVSEDDGGFLVTWSSEAQDGSNFGVFGRAFNNTGIAISAEFQINTHTNDLQKHIDISKLENGDLIAAWISSGQDGDGNGIFAQRLSTGTSSSSGSSSGSSSTTTMSSSSSSSSSSGPTLDSRYNAMAAITAIDKAIQLVNIQRSKLGAVSNRLSHTVNNLTNISSNLSAAQGGIEDADFAKETTDLAKNQILQQASTAMLAQANASKQNVLSLLQG